MQPRLATERLILAPLTLADAAAAQELFPHWEIVRYLASPPVPWPFPPDGALAFFRDVALPAMARGEQWTWTLRSKDAPERMIGVIELSDAEKNNRGFWLGLPWHGRGYMMAPAPPHAASAGRTLRLISPPRSRSTTAMSYWPCRSSQNCASLRK